MLLMYNWESINKIKMSKSQRLFNFQYIVVYLQNIILELNTTAELKQIKHRPNTVNYATLFS